MIDIRRNQVGRNIAKEAYHDHDQVLADIKKMRRACGVCEADAVCVRGCCVLAGLRGGRAAGRAIPMAPPPRSCRAAAARHRQLRMYMRGYARCGIAMARLGHAAVPGH